MRYLSYSLIILIPTLIWKGTYHYGAIKLVLASAIAFTWLLYTLYEIVRKERLNLPQTPLNYLLALFLIVAGLSLLHSPYREVGLHGLPCLFISIAIFYLSAGTLRDKPSIKNLYTLWFITAIPLSIYNILRWSLSNTTLPNLLGNKNFEAGYLVLTLPLVAALLISQYQKWRRPKAQGTGGIPALSLLMIILAISLVLTKCRGASLGMLAAGAILFLCLKRAGVLNRTGRDGSLCRQGGIYIIFTLALITLTLITLPTLRKASFDEMGSIGVRLNIWKGTLKMISARPLTGWGWGTFLVAHPPFAPPSSIEEVARHAHSEPLEIFAELGLAGFFIWASIIYLFLKSGLDFLKRSPDETLKVLVSGLLASCGGLLAHSLVSVNLRYPCSFILLSVMAGTVAGTVSPESSISLKGTKKLLAGTLAALSIIVAASAMSGLIIKPFLAQRQLLFGMKCAIRKPQPAYDDALKFYTKANLLDKTLFLAPWCSAEIYEAQGKYKKALYSCKKVEKIFPTFWRLHEKLASLYLKLGDEKEAMSEYRYAIKLKPAIPGLYLALGRLYIKGELWDSALRLYNDALRHGVVSSNIYNNLGNIYRIKGNFREAAHFYKLALRLAPGNAGIRDNLSYVQELL